MSGPETIIRVEGRVGRITLNRPEALNALTYGMITDIEAALTAWEHDDGVAMVLIDAAGDKAFAAGGDIVDLYETGRAGDFAWGRKFWRDEYRLNAFIARYPKPYVAIMNGIVMGGGVGVSAHGSHRVVSDATSVAMPECGIGLIPDVGGSLILARAPGRLGEYLAMTASRMAPADAILAGFADVYAPADDLETMVAAIEAAGAPDIVANFAALAEGGALADRQDEIDRYFAGDDHVAIIAALESEESEWAAKTARAIRRNCPISVTCALRAVRAAREANTIEAALATEYRFVWRCMEDGEFLEGIRAAVIDKDRNPRWARPTLEEITAADVDRMLAHLGADDLEPAA